tara:strand:+ start:1180 stop:1473 length:294 start_codon:yes stop_codon:yes gene_type:complete
MQLNNATSKSDLEDKVRSIVSRTWPSAPSGGPLGGETEDEYKRRLFDWLVDIAQSTPTAFQLLLSWCVEHSAAQKPLKEEKIHKTTEDRLQIQALKF